MQDTVFEGPLQTRRLKLHHLRNSHTGDRPRILFLGGSNFDLRLKRAVLNTALVRDFDFATFEPRGIGRSEQPPGSWTMADYAEDALSVLDTLGWPDAHIVGESFGGMTALHLAVQAPDRVKCMVISSATAGGARHRSFDISAFLRLPRKEAAAAALCLQDVRNDRLSKENPVAFAAKVAEREVFEKQFADPSVVNGGYARLLDARRDHDCTEQVHKVCLPTLVVVGRYDHQAPPDAQKALSDALPNGTYHSFDAGHGVLFSHPNALERATSFLTSHEHPTMALGRSAS